MIGPFFDILTFGWGPFFDHPAIVFDHPAIVFDDPANAGKCRQMPANAGKCRQLPANADKCQQLVEKRCVFQLLDGPVLRPPANAGKCRQMPAIAGKCPVYHLAIPIFTDAGSNLPILPANARPKIAFLAASRVVDKRMC